jgi:hypothetical protein
MRGEGSNEGGREVECERKRVRRREDWNSSEKL